jgi:hypothetical protein
MAQRKKLPDVMGELLSGNSRSTTQENTSKPVSQQTGMPAEQQDSEKVKATYYLSQQTLDGLEAAKLQLRRLARKDKRSISSSAIVDAALQLAFADLEAGGAKSTLSSKLVKQ